MSNPMTPIPRQPDTIRLACAVLDHNCERKPDSWESIHRMKSSKKMEREVLALLPIVRVIGSIKDSSPLRDFDFALPGNRFILQFADSEDSVAKAEFYINTEGYNYARYSIRLR